MFLIVMRTVPVDKEELRWSKAKAIRLRMDEERRGLREYAVIVPHAFLSTSTKSKSGRHAETRGTAGIALCDQVAGQLYDTSRLQADIRRSSARPSLRRDPERIGYHRISSIVGRDKRFALNMSHHLCGHAHHSKVNSSSTPRPVMFSDSGFWIQDPGNMARLASM